MGYAEQEAEAAMHQCALRRAFQDGSHAGFKVGQAEILTWAMKICGTGSTPSMIRKILHNKHVEITGDGEKA